MEVEEETPCLEKEAQIIPEPMEIVQHRLFSGVFVSDSESESESSHSTCFPVQLCSPSTLIDSESETTAAFSPTSPAVAL